DTGPLVSKFARHPAFNLVFAFPLFRYHFISRELDRAASTFRSAHKLLMRGQKVSKAEWVGSLADLISYITLPMLGYGVKAIASALADSLLGGAPPGAGRDDGDEARSYVGSSVRITTDPDTDEVKRKALPRELVTSNRINLTRILEDFGAPMDSETDLWAMYKDYPIVRSTATLYQAIDDAEKFGPKQGLYSMFTGIKDLFTSLTGAGQALKVPVRLWNQVTSEMEGDRMAPNFIDPYGTSVPLDAYLTLQALNLVPASRQADELIKWLDPVPRRVTRTKALDYDPGVVEALQAGGWTGLADRLARGFTTGSFASPLPPQGTVDKKQGYVSEPREHSLTERVGALLGVQLKDIPRSEYEEALQPE